MNKNISKVHLEVLDKQRQELLYNLFPFIQEFTLGGGTALVLQIAHRQLFAFDFFSFNELKVDINKKLSNLLTIDDISVNNKDEFTFLHYPFISHFKPLIFEDKLRIYSVKEVAIHKAYTIGRRGEYRDYFDLYSILKNQYIDFIELINLAKKVYGSLFNEKLFMEQLVYFGDLLDFNIIPISESTIPSPTDIKNYFEKLVSDNLSKIF